MSLYRSTSPLTIRLMSLTFSGNGFFANRMISSAASVARRRGSNEHGWTGDVGSGVLTRSFESSGV